MLELRRRYYSYFNLYGKGKMIPTVGLEDKIREIDKPWSPIEIARVNDFVVRLSLFHGEYDWHKHTDEDELFYVYRGKITIEIESQIALNLSQGQLAVVPKGVKHRPIASKPAYVMVIEPYFLKSKGD